MFKIEKNIPIPNNYRGSREKYPLSQLDVGDSFLVTKRHGKSQASLSAVCCQYAKNHGNCKFTVRKVPEGIRIWRIK